MTLLIGTDDGLCRVGSVPFDRDDAETVLDCGVVTAVETYDHTDDGEYETVGRLASNVSRIAAI